MVICLCMVQMMMVSICENFFLISCNNEIVTFLEFERPSESELIAMFHKFLTSAQVSITSKQYALVSLAKLSTRLQSCVE